MGQLRVISMDSGIAHKHGIDLSFGTGREREGEGERGIRQGATALTSIIPTTAGRIPVLVDNSQSPPFTVHETSAELFYLLKFADKQDKFGFADDLERNQALQWTL